MSGLPPQDYLNFEKRFIYVDAQHEPVKGSRIKWRRIKIEDLPSFAKECHNYNIFATIQQFAIYKKTENEDQYAPFYFDFDAKEPYTFKDVQEDVEKLSRYFFAAYDIDKSEIRFFFSGNRGMHILINPVTMGIEPHPELTYIYKNIAFYLRDLLGLKTLDPLVYSIRRLLRLPNSVHKTSGCYKIELDSSEISLSEEEIRKIAHSPRELLYSNSDYLGLSPNESLSSFYKYFLDFYKKQTEINKLKPQKAVSKSDKYPVCVQDLFDNSIKKSGTRSMATFFLSCYFKDQGYPEAKTFEIIYEWSQKIPKELTKTKSNELKASIKSCISSTYEDKTIGKNYHFVCSAIRSLEIKCDFDKCPIANSKDQEPEKIIELELAEASDGCFVGKKLSCKVMIIGKDVYPFLSPQRIQLSCKEHGGIEIKEGSKCANCLVGEKGGKVALDIPKNLNFILETINCTTPQRNELLRRIYARNCSKVNLEILEFRNIEEVELNPSIELSKNNTGDYVSRKGFFLGHKLDVNQEFNIIGCIVPDPKTQHVVHFFEDAKPLESSLSSFKMSSEMKKRLSIFQVSSKQTIEEKFDEIYTDLERNVLHIWQRRAMFIAMDLVYHSALRFKFNGELLQRGWTEAFIIGDSGQAKSDAFIKLKNHYGLGARVSGEGSRRTGLAWSWQQTGKHWFVRFGIIPNNDKRLVCIDEAAGMNEEELEKLTDMRECVLEDTKCLTKQGFKKYNEILIGEEIYTLNPKTLKAEWKPIKNIYIYENHNDEMIEINGRNISACVTPNHKWFIKIPSKKDIYKFKETKDFKKVYKIPLRAEPQEVVKKEVYSNDFVELIGWVITEGCYNAARQISISQSLKSNREKAERIKALIKKLSGERNYYYSKKGCITVRFSGDLAKKVRQLFPDKKLNYKFVNSLTLKQLKILKNTLIAGDGRKREKNESFYTTEVIHKDIFEYLCILIGLNCKIHKYLRSIKNSKHKDYYCCFVKKSKFVSPFSISRKKNNTQCEIKKINHKGIIWCPNTENQTFFAKRNDKIYITGNSGVADATGGPVPSKAYARTRLIWMSNARNGQSLRTFMFPIEAIQSVFKKSEDIRRLDLIIGVVTGTVSDNIIHQSAEKMPEIEHKFASDLCHSLVLWAWTRKPEDITITAEASEQIREVAMSFGRKYSAKIPIVEPAVQRIKIARLAVATAIRVFSTEDGEKVIVKKEHVDFIEKFLMTQYDDSTSLDYLNYTTNNRLDASSIYENVLILYQALPDVIELNKILMTTKYWVKNDLGDMLGYDKDQLHDVMKMLARNRLIEKVHGQYRMSTSGIDFVKRFNNELKQNKINITEKLEEKVEEPVDDIWYDK
jgi:hypothetical protein